MNRLQIAQQMRKALQMFAILLGDEKAMEIALVFDPWAAGKAYAAGDVVSYGTNAVGDPQLYRVVLSHTSQADWTPDSSSISLYRAIGLNAQGYPVWAQPAGAHDAYNKGDIVDYNGVLYESIIDGNVYRPDVYPGGWKLYEEE